MKLQSIELKFNYIKDDKDITIEAWVNENGWNQWKQSKAILSKNVELLEAITKTIIENARFEA